MRDERDNYRRLFPSSVGVKLARDRKCMVCNGTGFASCVKMLGRICDECRGSGEQP